MALAFRTVSDEVSWTDWASEDDRPARAGAAPRKAHLARAAAMVAGIVLLLAVIYFIPSSYT